MIKSIHSFTSKLKTKRIFLMGILVILLIIGLVFCGYYFARPYISNKLTQKSSADLRIEDKKLIISFNIVPDDQLRAESFINNIGADSKIYEGVSLDLDDQTLVRLEAVLPVKVTLDFSSKKLGFSNLSLPKLNSGAAGEVINFSTESGKLSIDHKGNMFHLEAEELDPLIKYATESGQLHLSKKLDPLYPILSKVARMRLDVDGKSINGEIELK